ncbi:glycine-rich cell wall structural protein 2-like [Miscanthus floridulus]|uniref:glycine-rich cell wall structural protein 2-like n=1 Tax=Miscanthus floridulus TaxID=154761 RepID=UPI00345B4ACF
MGLAGGAGSSSFSGGRRMARRFSSSSGAGRPTGVGGRRGRGWGTSGGLRRAAGWGSSGGLLLLPPPLAARGGARGWRWWPGTLWRPGVGGQARGVRGGDGGWPLAAGGWGRTGWRWRPGALQRPGAGQTGTGARAAAGGVVGDGRAGRSAALRRGARGGRELQRGAKQRRGAGAAVGRAAARQAFCGGELGLADLRSLLKLGKYDVDVHGISLDKTK